VLSIFTRSLWAPRISSRRDEEFVSALRNQEDQEWCNRIGVQRKAFQIPDASLRGYNDITEREQMLKVDQAERLLDNQLDRFPENCIVFCPLAIGSHIDHVIVRNVIIERFRSNSTKKMTLVLYEDLPYAFEFGSARVSEYAQAFAPEAVPWFVGSAGDLSSKLNALRIYESQIREEDLLAVSKYTTQLVAIGNALERWWVIDRFINHNTFFGDNNGTR
jgi:hypothetical protein